jgi:hypothetical protein
MSRPSRVRLVWLTDVPVVRAAGAAPCRQRAQDPVRVVCHGRIPCSESVTLGVRSEVVGIAPQWPEHSAAHFEPHASPVGERVEVPSKFRAAGIATFVFAGPCLPGNPERLATPLGKAVDWVLIDRMNCVAAVKRFYARHGPLDALEDSFFRTQAVRLAKALCTRSVRIKTVF